MVDCCRHTKKAKNWQKYKKRYLHCKEIFKNLSKKNNRIYNESSCVI